MGKYQSKINEERVIIAQNGAGNSAAAASAADISSERGRLELYLLFIAGFIIIFLAYIAWKQIKETYGNYMRRQLIELPEIVPAPRRVEPGSNSRSAQHVIM